VAGAFARHLVTGDRAQLAIDDRQQPLARAGVAPADIDVVQVYDSFTITVALTLEGLGFCGRGEALDWIAGGRIAPGGDVPMNTTGGGLSYQHPGMYGLLAIVEAARQLRGESTGQVDGAHVALAHGNGGVLSTQCTVLLGDESTL
jgi:acetyl-CoA acetyltransferase